MVPLRCQYVYPWSTHSRRPSSADPAASTHQRRPTSAEPEASDVAEPIVAGDRRPTSHQVVAEILRHRIALGDFPPGSRLPTERELADVLGVGRNTVRAALRQLT